MVGYLVLKLVQLARADADLTVLGSKMKPQYFQGRVVWITGASSGSKSRAYTREGERERKPDYLHPLYYYVECPHQRVSFTCGGVV